MTDRKPLMMLIAACVAIMMAFSGVGYAYTAISVNDNNNASANYVTITQEGTNVGAYTFGDAHITYDLVTTQVVETIYSLTDAVNLGVPQGETQGRTYWGVHGELTHTLELTGTLSEPSYTVQMWYTNIPDIGDWKAVFAYWPVGSDETNATKVIVDSVNNKASLTLTKDGSGNISYNFRAYTSAPDGQTTTALPRSVILNGAPFVAACSDDSITVNVDSRTGLSGKTYHNYADTAEAQTEYETKVAGADVDFKIIRTQAVAWTTEVFSKSITSVYQIKPSILSDLTVGLDTYKVVSFGGSSSYQTMTLTHQFSGNSSPSSYPVTVWYDTSTFPTLGNWKLIMEYWTDDQQTTDPAGNTHRTFLLGAGENNSNNLTLYPGTNGEVVYKVKLYFGSIGGTGDVMPPKNGAISDGTIIFKCTVG